MFRTGSTWARRALYAALVLAMTAFAGGAGDSGDRHWCDPDSYAVRYDFSRWPEWSARWRVEGPHKAYIMYSRYV